MVDLSNLTMKRRILKLSDSSARLGHLRQKKILRRSAPPEAENTITGRSLLIFIQVSRIKLLPRMYQKLYILKFKAPPLRQFPLSYHSDKQYIKLTNVPLARFHRT